MKRIFTISGGFAIPDGTTVYPFLNTRDSMSGLPWDLLDGFSVSAGDINPHVISKIHVMPHVTQVTFVLHGRLDVVMKDTENAEPYTQHLAEQQAVITRPGTFFQLVNATDTPCRAMYIVSPPYVFDMQGDQILYDDAIVLDEDWQALAGLNWQPPALLSNRITGKARQEALDRLARRAKGA